MIVWNLFFATSLVACTIVTDNTYSFVLLTIGGSMVSYPLIGWLADTRLGKFKVLCAAKWLLLVSIILKNTGTFIVGSRYLFYPSLIVWSLALACYWSCIIPFVTDQTVGASSEEICFTLLWLLWGACAGYCLASITFLLPKSYQYFYQLVLTLISYIAAFIWLEFCHHHVTKNSVISNPIKLIARVLNYACKHKYPERRSALTYWEKEHPSRLDLGKSKYGGPFTFEQVEDVKTVLRIIPLLVCASVGLLACFQKNELVYYKYQYSPNCKSALMSFLETVSDYPIYYSMLMVVVGLPLYYFLIFPFIRKSVPTIIRRIGGGVLLLACTYFIRAMVELVAASLSNTPRNITCIFKDVPSSECPAPAYFVWIVLPDLFKSLGVLLVLFGTFELIIAQAPQEIRSLLLCISTGITGVFAVLSYALQDLLATHPIRLYPSCLFYYCTCYFIIGTLALALYVYAAKRYKLRIRDDIVPFHMIAEEYFEREQANRSAYIQARQLEWDDADYWTE